MSQPFVAEIIIAGFNFPPRGFAFCNGQLLPISQNTALFSLLGTFYGGDGVSTFALPDLQGRAANHFGQGAGLSVYLLGQNGGQETHTLVNSEMPVHNHGVTTLNSVSVNGNLKVAGGNLPAGVQGTNTNIYSNQAPNAANTGMFAVGGSPHNNLQPLLALNFCIALQGVFPARS
jgi:microcystin-dependent protein